MQNTFLIITTQFDKSYAIWSLLFNFFPLANLPFLVHNTTFPLNPAPHLSHISDDNRE